MPNKLAHCPAQREWPKRGLVSLWDMLEYNAGSFYEYAQLLEKARNLAQSFKGEKKIFGAELRLTLSGNLGELRAYCEQLKAKSAVRHLDRFIDLCRNDFEAGDFPYRFDELTERIREDLQDRSILILSEDDGAYYNNAVPLFGDEVVKAFPRAVADLEEAGKCLGLERYTASAFHLMRALEVPLQILGKRFLPNDPRPNWDPVLKAIDSELKKEHKDRTIKGEVDFYAGVSAHMHAVKLAWRNRFAHIDAIVPPDKARDIFNATRGLMRHLAEHLAEEPGLS